jgi:hypothetical protein
MRLACKQLASFAVAVFALIAAAANAHAQHETHGTGEPSPRAGDDIVRLLLAKSGTVKPRLSGTETLSDRNVIDLFSSLIAAQTHDEGLGKDVNVTSLCNYLGDAAGIPGSSDEDCRITIFPEQYDDVRFFRFTYSSSRDEVSNVIYGH